MSERPETGTPDATTFPGWNATGPIPWGKSLWGTEIDFGGAAKLVIDRNGVGRFTDPSGEKGIWDPDTRRWVDEDDHRPMHPGFGLPGVESRPDESDDDAFE